jgi:hypothetical protein
MPHGPLRGAAYALHSKRIDTGLCLLWVQHLVQRRLASRAAVDFDSTVAGMGPPAFKRSRGGAAAGSGNGGNGGNGGGSAGRGGGGGGGGGGKQSVVHKLIGVHDTAIERLKAATTIMLFLPKGVHDTVEAAAADWKKKSTPGKPHPDGHSCISARFKAMINAISLAGQEAAAGADQATPPMLACTTEAKAAYDRIVAVVAGGRSDAVVAEITLRHASSREAHQSPYEITIVNSAQGHDLRTALFGTTQPAGGATTNTKEMQLKVWEVRPYHPQRGGALVSQLR